MKKICTASSCRKAFSYQNDKLAVCPFCGKEYPRLNNFGSQAICSINGRKYNLSFLLFKKEIYSNSKIKTIREIILTTDIRLFTAKKIADYLFTTGMLAVVVSISEDNEIKIQKARKIW